MANEQPVAPKSDKVVIYSVGYNAIFSKVLKSSTRPQGLKFDNGIAIVTKDELVEVKKSEYWGRSISDKKFTDQKPPVKVNTDKEK